jgi:hypothetical protein
VFGNCLPAFPLATTRCAPITPCVLLNTSLMTTPIEENDAYVASARNQDVELAGRRMNARAPICCVPQEVIYRIVRLARGWDPAYEDVSELDAWKSADQPEDMHRSNSTWSWETFFNTCTYMRQMGAAAAELHSYVRIQDSYINTHLLGRQLARSSNRRLILDFGSNYDIEMSKLNPRRHTLIVKMLSQARAVRFLFRTIPQGHSISRFLHGFLHMHDAPDLEELQLQCSKNIETTRTHSAMRTEFLQHRFFALKTMHLKAGLLAETVPDLPNLRFLYLTNCRCEEPHMRGFWCILSSAPLLEHLEVRNFGVQTDPEPVEAIPAADYTRLLMVHLRTIIIDQRQGRQDVVHAFLHRLPHPQQRLDIIIDAAERRREFGPYIDERVRLFWELRSGRQGLAESVHLSANAWHGEIVVRGSSSQPPVQLRYQLVVDVPIDDPLLAQVCSLDLLWFYGCTPLQGGLDPQHSSSSRLWASLRRVTLRPDGLAAAADDDEVRAWAAALARSLGRPLLDSS